jgi:phosphoribosylglycinamide formyltransferase-1
VSEQFIGAAIQPDVGSIDATRLVTGQPEMPQRFLWNQQTYQVVRVIRTWRDAGSCTHGSGERYVRKHWFEVMVDTGQIMKIYFDRQPRSGKKSKRWWLYSVSSPA